LPLCFHDAPFSQYLEEEEKERDEFRRGSQQAVYLHLVADSLGVSVAEALLPLLIAGSIFPA
jgi:hypothetical protein